MPTDGTGGKAYPPSFIHAFYAWLERMPIPVWLSIILLFPIVGLVQHLVAWRKGALGAGELNFDLGTAGYWLVGILLIGLYVLKGAAQALDEYRPLLKVTEEEYARLNYDFVIIPHGWGILFFLAGMALGAVTGLSDMAVAPAIDYVFPQLRIGIWMLGTGTTLLFLYQVIRQLQQIRALYAMPESIDLFKPRPLYGFSRYTAVLGVMVFSYEVLVPLVLDPTAYASQVAYTGSLALTPLILLMFYLPLSGVHRRLVSEKQRLLDEANSRIAILLERIHQAAIEQQDYRDVGGMRTVFSTLVEEKESLQALRTWPWRPGTLTGLLSALFLPIILVVVREIILMIVGPRLP